MLSRRVVQGKVLHLYGEAAEDDFGMTIALTQGGVRLHASQEGKDLSYLTQWSYIRTCQASLNQAAGS